MNLEEENFDDQLKQVLRALHSQSVTSILLKKTLRQNIVIHVCIVCKADVYVRVRTRIVFPT